MERFKTGTNAMLIALLVGLAIMALKFVAYWITGSSAILSDALESIINVVASGFALGSLVLSAKPPDESHPYGHGKIEYFSAGFEGALIILAAAGIFVEGSRQVLAAEGLPRLEDGLGILVGVSAANLLLGLFLIRTGKRIESVVLIADGKHIITDVYSTGGVLVGLVVVHLTGWNRLDGIIACLVGVYVLLNGALLMRAAFGGLMDASDPALLDQICSVLEKNRQELWIDVHRLRAKRSGSLVHIDFHLILPRDLPLEAGHSEVKRLERIFADHFGGEADVLIHLDPCKDPECPVCANDPCTLRKARKLSLRTWKREAVTSNGEIV